MVLKVLQIRYVNILLLLLLLIGCKSNKIYTKNDAKHIITNKNALEKVYKKYKGTPYLYGGTTSHGFDCSGFVQRAYMDAFKKKLPRTTKAMMKYGKKINKSALKIGDLVFFHPTRRYYHVGIYMGDGVFMHASSSRGVMKSNLSLKYWQKSYVMSRRIP